MIAGHRVQQLSSTDPVTGAVLTTVLSTLPISTAGFDLERPRAMIARLSDPGGQATSTSAFDQGC